MKTAEAGKRAPSSNGAFCKVKRFFNSQKVAPWIFVSPFVLTFLIFFAAPLVETCVMSFQNILPGESTFIGLDNYTKLFQDKIFWKAVSNSVLYMVLTLLLLIPIPMVVAVFLNNKVMVGKGFFKSALFIPALTSVVVAGTIFRLMFGEVEGSMMNQLMKAFGQEPVKWLNGSQSTVFVALLLLACWRWLGVNMLYFLSGLQSIPADLYEAADIDGANAWKKFVHITIPNLKPTIVYVLTISIYGGLAMFTESYMLFTNNNSPKNMGLTIVGYLYRAGIEQNRMGYASAVGLVLLIIAMVINIAQLKATGMLKKEGKD